MDFSFLVNGVNGFPFYCVFFLFSCKFITIVSEYGVRAVLTFPANSGQYFMISRTEKLLLLFTICFSFDVLFSHFFLFVIFVHFLLVLGVRGQSLLASVYYDLCIWALKIILLL